MKLIRRAQQTLKKQMRAVLIAVIAIVMLASMTEASMYQKVYTGKANCNGTMSYYVKYSSFCQKPYYSSTSSSYGSYYYDTKTCTSSSATYKIYTCSTCADSCLYVSTTYTRTTNQCYTLSTYSYKYTCSLSAGSVVASLVGAAAVIVATLI